jgi:nucleotidyltransferase/DNA polymerase involved in DNA repair
MLLFFHPREILSSVERAGVQDLPMAVGGMGMLSTSNYAARKFGVRAAMPGFIGKKLCPDLVIVPSNMESYAREAEKIRAVFRAYDPNFAPMSLDEAYMDLTEYLDCHPDLTAAEVVKEMRARQCSGSTCHFFAIWIRKFVQGARSYLLISFEGYRVPFYYKIAQ